MVVFKRKGKVYIPKCADENAKYSGGWLLVRCRRKDGTIGFGYVRKPRGGH